jgi:hypothetical protein
MTKRSVGGITGIPVTDVAGELARSLRPRSQRLVTLYRVVRFEPSRDVPGMAVLVLGKPLKSKTVGNSNRIFTGTVNAVSR